MQKNLVAARTRIAINAVAQIADLFDAILKIGPQDYATLRACALRGHQLSNATLMALSDDLAPIKNADAIVTETA